MNELNRDDRQAAGDGHPSAVELELARTSEAELWVTEHLAGCAACRAEAALLAELAAGIRVEVTPAEHGEDDAAVMTTIAARSRLGRQRWRLGRPLGWAAAAAAVLACGLWLTLSRPNEAVAGDVNRDGRVDILDAFAVARQLQHGGAGPESDVNGDGRVDEADVELLARQAVALPGGEAL